LGLGVGVGVGVGVVAVEAEGFRTLVADHTASVFRLGRPAFAFGPPSVLFSKTESLSPVVLPSRFQKRLLSI